MFHVIPSKPAKEKGKSRRVVEYEDGCPNTSMVGLDTFTEPSQLINQSINQSTNQHHKHPHDHHHHYPGDLELSSPPDSESLQSPKADDH